MAFLTPFNLKATGLASQNKNFDFLARFGYTGHNKHMKKLLLALPILLGVTLAGRVSAAEPTSCDLSQEYKSFLAATEAPSYTQAAIQRELESRIDLLNATIDCAKEELQALKNGLSDAANAKATEVRDRVFGAIDDGVRFYDIKKSVLSGQGIQGTKDVAREIKDWREANYNSLLGRVQNFLIWNDNQKIFDIASDRISQSQFIVSSLKIIDSQEAQNFLSAARDNWNEASNLNNRAGDAISQGLTPDETIDIIKQSLSTLATAYKSFLGIGSRLTGEVSTSTNQ